MLLCVALRYFFFLATGFFALALRFGSTPWSFAASRAAFARSPAKSFEPMATLPRGAGVAFLLDLFDARAIAASPPASSTRSVFALDAGFGAGADFRPSMPFRMIA